MALMTIESAQAILTEAAGKPVIVTNLRVDEDGPSIEVSLEDGDAWTISPGPGWCLTVTDPDQRTQLIEFREESPSP